MRLVTYSRSADGAPRVGLLEGGQVVDLAEAAPDMLSLVAAGPSGLEAVRQAASRGARTPLDRVRLYAPIPRPRKNVFCTGWNYLEHFKEGDALRTGQSLPERPAFFTKAVTAVTGPNDPIPYDPQVSERIDWEVELVVVIGPGGKNIPESRAGAHVFGYTAMNDLSARDIQRGHGGQWFKGKSLDGHCPMGPCLVTVDEIGDPDDLAVRTRVNGVTKQDSNTRHFYFKIPRLIAELSLGLTLEPGDLISTGTPEGVGYGRTPPEFLRPGDLLETEIERIGVLRNRIGG